MSDSENDTDAIVDTAHVNEPEFRGTTTDHSLEEVSNTDADIKTSAEQSDSTENDAVSNHDERHRQESRIGSMPVDITVELGTLSVDATDSGNLSVGDVLNLESSCPGLVRLMYNYQEIGRAELVDINGRLGLQIVDNWSRS